MALNYFPLSQRMSLFVANQFRVCVRQTAIPFQRCYSKDAMPWVPVRILPFRSWGNKRILYQQTSLCCWRDIQNFSSTPKLFNPHTSLVRPKCLRNKTGSESPILPFMSKTGKKKKLTRVKSCQECGKKLPSKEKLKIYRPAITSSSATTPNTYVYNQKPPREKKPDRAEKQNEVVSVPQIAKEMVDYFNKFIDHLNKIDKTLRLRKIRDSYRNYKYTDTSIPLIRPVKENTNPQTSSNVSAGLEIREYKAAGKKTHSKKKKASKIDYDLEKMSAEVNRAWKETCTHKDSMKEKEFLEIRPKFVQNIQRRKDSVNLKNAFATTAAKNVPNREMKPDVKNTGFILVESINAKIVENKVQLKDQGGIPCNEKGFILIYPEESQSDQSSLYCSGEKGFILVNDKGKSDVGQRRSKEDSRNFVLVNDNPCCNSRNTRTSVDDSKASQVSNVKDVLPRPEITVQLHMEEKGALGCTSVNSKHGGNAQNRTSSLLDKQTIGSSDSKEELKRQRQTVCEPEPAFVTTQRSKSDRAVELQSLNLDDHDRMLQSKSEYTGPKLSERTGKGTLSEGKMAESKKIDDSGNKNNSIKEENFAKSGDGTTKGRGIKTKENAARNYDIVENGEIKKVKKLFQGGTVVSKSAHDLHVDAFGNAMKGYSKLNVEPAQGKKKTGKKGVVRHANSAVNLTTKEKTKSQVKEIRPVPSEICKRTTLGSVNKLKANTLATSQTRMGFNSCSFKQQRSPAIAVRELKPDLSQKKEGRHSAKVNMAMATNSNEPQLFVKPEEMSSKGKLGSRPESDMIYAAEQKWSPQISSQTYCRVDKSPQIKEATTSSPKTPLDENAELEQLYKIHFQEMNKDQKHILSGREETQDASMKAASETTGLSSSRNEESTVQVTKGMTLSDVFRQLQHTTNTKIPLSLSPTANKLNAVAAKRSSRKNEELMRAIQHQWSQDFQEKFHNLQPTTLYGPFEGNCSTEATQNSNTSAGSKLEKEKKTTSHTERKSKHRSPPEPIKVQVSRKSDHLPTMGMAERLFAASLRPPGPIVVNDLSANVKDSESSMNTYTDATGTQGTVEDDFPEVDQFEEFVQNKMPEIFSDNQINTTQTGATETEPISKKSTNDGLKLPNKEPVDDLRLYEGSNVDGDLFLQTTTQQPKPSNNAEPIMENNQLYNLITVRAMDDRHPDEKTPDTFCVTTPRSLHGDKSASMTNTSLARGLSAHNLKDTTKFARMAGSAMDISHRVASSRTSTVTHAGGASKGASLSKSQMLKTLDGFACLTLVEEPQMPPLKNLKPTLKRSPSRDRGEEKRVSFERASMDDASKFKYPGRDRYNKQSDKFAGSPVDRPLGEDNVSGGNNSKETEFDLRNKLAEQRKRAEMEARIKLLNEHTKQIREYEAVLSKYRDIVGKFRDDALKAIRSQGGDKQKSSEV